VFDSSDLAAPNLGAAARAAAIAAMGHRLAAAGPRTRQRARSRAAAPTHQADPPAAAASDPRGVDTRDDILAWIDPPARAPLSARPRTPMQPHVAALWRGALLGAAALCGFGLVIVALRMDVAQHNALRLAKAAPVLQAAPAAPAVTPDSAIQHRVATMAAPSQYVRADRPHHKVEVAHLAVATPSHAPAPRPRSHAPQPLLAHAAAKPHPLATAREDWPSWLTDGSVVRPPAVIMSEPPHNLVHPADPA
jgi:hypothetical protein